MKKVFIPIVFLISMSIVTFIIFTEAKKGVITNEKALELGEEKYLKFLWMVDGAFNSERLNEDFLVNDKRLSNEDKVFTCKYKHKNDVECVGNNFEKEFKKLFSKDINYKNVYSDGLDHTWYEYRDGNYIFSNLNSCGVNRMGINQQIKVINITNDKIMYQVNFKDDMTNKEITRNFSLILEDDEWKINMAYYYDLCGMKYYIG